MIQVFNPNISGNRIKQRRRTMGLTQKELAEQSGLSLSAIKSFECGKRVPDTRSLFLLSDVLMISERYIVGWE